MDDPQTPLRELRLALSMNGGVSLAVWIGGSCAEVDELRRGVGFWGELLTAAGYLPTAQLDVMAGASAGGLNAVMMAQAIRANRPFREFFPLWLDDGDIDKLVKAPSEALARDERAVFKGWYFLESLHQALETAQLAATEPPPDHDLAVFASATMVRANRVAFRDVPGDPIRDSRSDAYFHVAKRGPASLGLDGFDVDDPAVLDNLEALALIGRATSSLPGLFEPVSFGSSFGSRLVGALRPDRPEVQIMDGGVIDNVPVARAIRAIYQSPATGHVRRVLLYLHPDPGGEGAAQPDPRNALGVVQSFFGKRAETIRDDIELLRAHNDAVARRNDEATVLLEQLLAGDGTSDAPAELASGIFAALLLRAAVDPAAELHWHAPAVPRVAPLIDAPADVAKDELAAELGAAVAADRDVLRAARVHQRVAALQRVLRMAQDEVATLDVRATLARLNHLELLCQLVTSHQLGNMLLPSATAPASPVARLQLSAQLLSDLRVPPGLSAPVWRGLANWELPPSTVGGVPLVDEMARMLDAAVATLEPPAGGGLGCATLRWLAVGDRGTRVSLLADALLPLAAEPVASDQHIDFVRIAGNVTTPASVRFMVPDVATATDRYGDRIAGKQLHHLGAFFDRDWRENDLRWGRLDSVPGLIDAVLDDTAMATLASSGMVPADVVATGDGAVRDWLVATRQAQLVTEFTNGSDTAFEAWRTHDRRLASLLGGRPLTSTAVRGTITATRVLAYDEPRPARVATVVLRPVLLAVAGLVLAGRWATAALAWTLCVLAATRGGTGIERWLVWGVGTAAAAATAWLVERMFAPVRTPTRVLPPYVLAVAGVGAGLALVTHMSWVVGDVPLVHVSRVWVVPAAAAATTATTLFFWMRWYACVVLVAAVFNWYGWFAYAAARHRDNPVPHWPQGWPFHSMWVAWTIAVLGLPVLIGRLPDSWLRPGGSTA